MHQLTKFKICDTACSYSSPVMASSEPLRSRAYHEDLKWRMIYQRKMLGLTYQHIALNLCVDTSTVWRAVKRFDDEGTVAAKKNKGYHKLSDHEEFAILEALVERPSMYLKEVCTHTFFMLVVQLSLNQLYAASCNATISLTRN